LPPLAQDINELQFSATLAEVRRDKNSGKHSRLNKPGKKDSDLDCFSIEVGKVSYQSQGPPMMHTCLPR
jgi:hypothetical protein